MKNKILLFAAVMALMINLSSCITGHHHKDAGPSTTAPHSDEQDHKEDNAPR